MPYLSVSILPKAKSRALNIDKECKMHRDISDSRCGA
jgi:hypothetical protein